MYFMTTKWIVFCSWLTVICSMPVKIENSHGTGGQFIATATDVGSCLYECGERPQECYGLDWDWTTFRCYFHDSTTECSDLVSKNGVIHYRFTECPRIQPTRGATSGFPPNAGGITSGFPQNTVGVTSGFPANTVAPPIPPAGKPSNGDPQLSDAVTYPDVHIPGGTAIPTAASIQDCLAVCTYSRSCQGFEWNYLRSECTIHTYLTECDPFENKPGVNHFRLKANCEPVVETCFYKVFQDYSSATRDNGMLILTGESYEACKTLCSVTDMCQAVTYVQADQRCLMHATTGLPRPDACCLHSRKLCDDPTTPLGPTTRVTTPGISLSSTAPPAVSTTPSTATDDSGKCPAQLQAFPGTRSLDGIEVEDVNDTEACKVWCLGNDTCAAVDFDLATDDDIKCFWHSNETYDIELIQQDEDWIQYRKLTECETKRCWVMEQLVVTDDLGGEYAPIEELLSVSSNSSDTYPDIVLEECEGLCVVEAAFTIDSISGAFSSSGPGEAARYCDTTTDVESMQKLGRSCQLEVISEDDDVKNVSMLCFCQTDSCNAFWAQMLQATIAHYPLDCNALDLTFAGRDGQDFSMGYSGVDQAKNWSGVFNGSNHIEVHAFMSLLLGQIGPSPNYYITPNFTVFCWFKFTAVIDDIMTMISNNPHGQASIDVYTEYRNRTHRSITGTVKIQGIEYSGTVVAPYDEWRYFALRIIPNEITSTLELSVSTGDVTQEHDYDITDTGIAVTETGVRLDPTMNKLSIGKQQDPLPVLGGIPNTIEPEYYIGMMDEIWFFARGVSDFELNALAEASYYPQRLDTS